MILLPTGLLWGQTQPAGQPETTAKPSPSPSPAVGSPIAGPKTTVSPRSDFDVTKTTPDADTGGFQILSDTGGVDFAPYMKELKAVVQKHWDPLIPASAMPPIKKRGHVVIELAILKDGSIQGMKLVSGSGDVALDRAAWGALTSSSPLPALPAAYRPEYLRLRTAFYYNPGPADIAKPPTQSPTPQPKPDPKN